VGLHLRRLTPTAICVVPFQGAPGLQLVVRRILSINRPFQGTEGQDAVAATDRGSTKTHGVTRSKDSPFLSPAALIGGSLRVDVIGLVTLHFGAVDGDVVLFGGGPDDLSRKT